MKRWTAYHSLAAHLVAPIWIRVPEKLRWRIVHRLDRSRKRAWCHLVGAALAYREDDACDIATPLGCKAGDCATTCYFMGGAVVGDHHGEHPCSCYCGKFKFTATRGYDQRRDGIPS